MLLFTLLHPALACGGFVPTEGALAASSAQRALFDLGADAVTVTYDARYAGNAADFAWVIAVPGPITDVAEGDAELLADVERASAPQVEVDPAVYEEGCSCAPQTKGDAGGGFSNDDAGVVVTGSGFAGNLAYTTLAASDADSLAVWLDEHGYDTSYIGSAIEQYVSDPLDYEFVAVQLRPDTPETPEGGVLLDPLRITYGAAADGALHLVFPAMLGRSSTVETVRTEMYVLATGTATLGGGWEAPANPPETEEDPWDLVLPDYASPDGAYYSHLLSLGGEERQMWMAYAGAYATDAGERWLTRYDAIVYPATNTVDPVFTDSGERTEASTLIYVMEEAAFERSYDTGTAWLLPLGLLAGVGLRRRR